MCAGAPSLELSVAGDRLPDHRRTVAQVEGGRLLRVVHADGVLRPHLGRGRAIVHVAVEVGARVVVQVDEGALRPRGAVLHAARLARPEPRVVLHAHGELLAHRREVGARLREQHRAQLQPARQHAARPAGGVVCERARRRRVEREGAVEAQAAARLGEGVDGDDHRVLVEVDEAAEEREGLLARPRDDGVAVVRLGDAAQREGPREVRRLERHVGEPPVVRLHGEHLRRRGVAARGEALAVEVGEQLLREVDRVARALLAELDGREVDRLQPEGAERVQHLPAAGVCPRRLMLVALGRLQLGHLHGLRLLHRVAQQRHELGHLRVVE
eukprot:scaffold137393_cov118-Phaeocystis_antarctica.AAC.1